MNNNTTFKTCNKCLEILPITDFYIRNKKTNLRRNMCKKCMYEESKLYKEKNKKRIQQLSREYSIKNKEKLNKYLKQYQQDNKEKLAEVKAEYYQKNKEDIRKYNSEYYEKNKDKIIKNVAAYSKTEKGIISKKNTSNRRRLAKQKGHLKTSEILKLKKNSKKCYWCGEQLNKKYHLDHYIPISKGGEHAIDNIVISCPTCNIKKSNKDPMEFAISMGRLL